MDICSNFILPKPVDMYLNCKTVFSFRYGTLRTEELVQTAADLGISSLALTNINSTAGIWDFVLHCRNSDIKAIAGAEIRNGSRLLYILIAKNNIGLAWINRFISEHLLNKKSFPEDLLFYGKAKEFDGFIIYPLGSTKPSSILGVNEYIGVRPSEVNKLYGAKYQHLKNRLVVLQPVSFQSKKHYNLHRLLRAIDTNVLLSKLDPAELAYDDEVFLSPARVFEIFKGYPCVVSNTLWLMEQCSVEMDFSSDKTKKLFGSSAYEDKLQLESLSMQGLRSRYGDNLLALERLQKELGIIDSMGFNAYFLRTWDMIQYARHREFYYVGRGSGANSIVAHCLHITEVDPIELDLYFERFLNPERTSPPDFDIDFSWRDRDEMIRYMFRRYGKEHVCLLGTYSTFREDSIVRELGKVFGLPKEEIDDLGDAKSLKHQLHKLILQYGALMMNFPNHMSIHAGGMLISEEPIHHYTSCFMPPKGFETAHLDMYVAESIGLYKLDILSQRGLGHIKESIRLVRENKGEEIDIQHVEKFKDDPNVRRQIKEVNTIGCFYIESPAMRQLLGKLRCDDYTTLVSASSIVRPGVASSGMLREYVTRFRNPGKIVYMHPLFEEQLSGTFGVMVFQEDVIKIAHLWSGLSHAKADILRRAMSLKYRTNNQFSLVRSDFFEGAKKLGRSQEQTKEIWRQMESFAGYSFCKAHSASFAVESFQDLYLKCYHPKEFIVGVINNFGGYYPTSLYFYELLKIGANLHLPCVNCSQYYTSIRGNDVWTGFIHIKHMQEQITRHIVDERRQNGAFESLCDFMERITIGEEQLNTLISVGAFRFTGKNKKHLLWEANFLKKKMTASSATRKLFGEKPGEFQLPDLSENPLDELYDEKENLGFLLRNPFELADADPARYTTASELKRYKGKQVSMLTYYVAYKHVPVKNDQYMFFGTFLDPNLDWVDTVHFPVVARKYPMTQDGYYVVHGKVIEEFGMYSVEVSRMETVGAKQRLYANL